MPDRGCPDPFFGAGMVLQHHRPCLSGVAYDAVTIRITGQPGNQAAALRCTKGGNGSKDSYQAIVIRVSIVQVVYHQVDHK